MRIGRGTVIDGKVVMDGEPLVEGATVTVLSVERDAAFELDADAERQLFAALGEAQRGEGVDGDALLEQLEAR